MASMHFLADYRYQTNYMYARIFRSKSSDTRQPLMCSIKIWELNFATRLNVCSQEFILLWDPTLNRIGLHLDTGAGTDV